MGKRDLELLLAVKSSDSVTYQQLWDMLTQYADSVASALFSSPTLRDEAVEKAMDKAEDWLKSDGILYTNRPWAFVRKIVSNSLIDSSRTRKLEEVDITSVGGIDKDILRYTDDELRKEFVKADDIEDDAQGSGWQVFQIVSEGRPRKEDDARYHPHKWIEALEELLKYSWWWGTSGWLQKIESERKRAMQSLRGSGREASYYYKEHTVKLWSTYNLAMALIDRIQRPSERRIMKAYLEGLKQVEISEKFSVKKPFVSRIVNHYLEEWGWDESDIYKTRLILFTHRLATLYREFEYDREIAINTYYKKGHHPILENLVVIDIQGSFISPSDYQSYSTRRIKSHYREIFYNKLVNSPETKVYFGDLDRESGFLHSSVWGVFFKFQNRWYGIDKRLIRLSWD